MPKVHNTSLDSRQALRHNPLVEDYSPSSPLKQKVGKKRSRRDDADNDAFVDSRASQKILQIGRELVEEEREEKTKQAGQEPNPAFEFGSRFGEDELDEASASFDDDDDQWGDEEEEEIEEVEVDPNDLELFNRFNPSFDDPILRPGESDEAAQSTNLADLILEKIAAFEAGQGARAASETGDEPPDGAIELPAKVVEAFSKVGLLLSRYKSGKLPKIFKILPTLPNWEILLSITHPENWTPNAVYAGTRIFVASKPAITQLFLSEVLLPRVHEDIYESKKLNVHLYNAIKKALFKPASFFKGFLFPMLSGGTCTQREATIVASVITRVSVPRDHSAAALYRLCDIAADQMSANAESAGATNICIRALLEKKYALPYRVIDALVFHFLRFKAVDPASVENGEAMDGVAGPGSSRALAEARLPVIWHQCLLAFAQRYRDWITEDQREALLDLLLDRGHSSIGPEVRRELLAGRGRGVPVAEGKIGDGEDDTMVVDG